MAGEPTSVMPMGGYVRCRVPGAGFQVGFRVPALPGSRRAGLGSDRNPEPNAEPGTRNPEPNPAPGTRHPEPERSRMVLDDIADEGREGYALTAADAEALASTYDIVSLGMVADDVRRATHGTRTTFLRVAHRAGRLAGRASGVVAVRPRGARRLPRSSTSMTRVPRCVGAAAAAAGVAISGFSLADIEQAAGGEIARSRTWFDALHDAGLATIDEAPVDVLREPAALLQAAEAAGVPVARLTVHRGAPEGPLPLIRRVAALQAETNAVRVFAPIPRRPGAEPTTGYDDVKAVALARILLPSVPHIQVDWTLARSQARAGGADVWRRRPRQRVAARRGRRGTSARAARRDSPQHSGGRLRAGRARCPFRSSSG